VLHRLGSSDTCIVLAPGVVALIHFAIRLTAAVRRTKTPVVVGLDPRLELLPRQLQPRGKQDDWPAIAGAYRTFCREVIDVVAPLVPAVKPQAAFFEQLGPAGGEALADVIQYAISKHLLVILDGKRNDIGSTAVAYAHAYLGHDSLSGWGADALTVNPYLGDDALRPFVEIAQQQGAGLFVLVKTSNPGSGLFQDLVADGKSIYRHVADFVQQLAAETVADVGYGSVGAVVGATYPEQLAELRQAMPNTWFLVPGYGSQGAGARDVAEAFDQRGLGALVNSSRAIIFAFAREAYSTRFGDAQWQDAVEAATLEMIHQLHSETAAGKLNG